MLLTSFLWCVAVAQEPAPQPTAPAPVVAPPSNPAIDDLPVLELAKPIEGEITGNDSIVHTPRLDKDYTDAPVRGKSYEVHFDIAGTYTIELRSYFFDAYLVVRDAKGNLVAEDDDGLLRTHSRVVLGTDAVATFQIVACALHGVVGSFGLYVVSGPPATRDAGQHANDEIEDARAELGKRDQVLGPEHVATAVSLVRLASLLQNQGRFDEARPLLVRAVSAFDKTLGPEHPATAASLHNLAALLDWQGKYEEAQPFIERALAIDEKVSGSEDPSTASDLDLLGIVLFSQGQYEEARPLYERALAIREKAFGPKHLKTAKSLSALANLFCSQGRYEEARPLFERALNIDEQVLGPEHPSTAISLDNLAGLLQQEGKFEAARPLFERALAIQEKALGPGSSVLHGTVKEKHDAARSLDNLAGLLNSQGKYEEARPLYERALEIDENAFGPTNPETATSLENLGLLFLAEGHYEEARPLLERAQRIREEVLGPDHPDTAKGVNNLAVLSKLSGKYDDARTLSERALATCEKVLGAEHPITATSLSNLAGLLACQGRYSEAQPLFERALAIDEKVLGSEHPDTTTILDYLAVNDLDLRAVARARDHSRQTLRLRRMRALEEVAGASETGTLRALAFVKDAMATLLSASTTPAERSSDAVYMDVLLTKGEAFRQTFLRRNALMGQSDPETVAALDHLRTVRAEMSNLFSVREIKDRTDFDRNIERLRKDREKCEASLTNILAVRPALQPVTPAEVRAALPKDAVLLDFLEHALYEPAQWNNGRVVKIGTWGQRRFSVWITRSGEASATWVDLGPSAPIEAATTDLLRAIIAGVGRRTADPRGAAPISTGDITRFTRSDLSRRLRRLIWDPLVPEIGGATVVLVAADGCIATAPLGALEGEDGRALVESLAFLAIDDVTSFSSSSLHATATRSLLCVGDVDYDNSGERVAKTEAHPDMRGSFGGQWPRLSATGAEVSAIEQLFLRRFPDAPRCRLTTSAANEEAVKQQVPDFSVLHFATHGYFEVEGLKSITGAILEPSGRDRFRADERALVAGYWPEFLCGIVCAGANRPQPGRDNGLLTGDEVSGLDLSRCDLVVLSACETALGKRQAGEGMLSLTRSFRIAGAKTVISSLWQVRDDSTKDLMLDFYDRLWTKGESKLDALRGAQLDMLKKNREKYGDTKPATWAAFVLTGEAE